MLSVVPNFSRTFSTKNPRVYSNHCFSVMLLSALRRINPPDGDALSRPVPIISLKFLHCEGGADVLDGPGRWKGRLVGLASQCPKNDRQ
jgi:hypothetical protein